MNANIIFLLNLLGPIFSVPFPLVRDVPEFIIFFLYITDHKLQNAPFWVLHDLMPRDGAADFRKFAQTVSAAVIDAFAEVGEQFSLTSVSTSAPSGEFSDFLLRLTTGTARTPFGCYVQRSPNICVDKQQPSTSALNACIGASYLASQETVVLLFNFLQCCIFYFCVFNFCISRFQVHCCTFDLQVARGTYTSQERMRMICQCGYCCCSKWIQDTILITRVMVKQYFRKVGKGTVSHVTFFCHFFWKGVAGVVVILWGT